eukprot:gnl/Carplike_NY0171/388_a536_3316.p1 GENE.gnl/Carplike_NY0171/388_a536_3316~~gnl/Carplike_NY0171/388_a536_3316.p1  ORF type:complete len:236 (+),score=91.04 gnl/Carplike_NY0171/388_a536_3316:71-709(+)
MITTQAENEAESQRIAETTKARKEIDFQYEKKCQRREEKRKIKLAQAQKDAQLSVLEERKKIIDSMYETIRERISLMTGSEKYEDIIVDLIKQAAVTLQKPELLVQCRPCDKHIVESAIGKVNSLDAEELGVSLKSLALSTYTLGHAWKKGEDPAGSCLGGIVVSDSTHELNVDCTFDARLAAAKRMHAPALRSTLFADEKKEEEKEEIEEL